MHIDGQFVQQWGLTAQGIPKDWIAQFRGNDGRIGQRGAIDVAPIVGAADA